MHDRWIGGDAPPAGYPDTDLTNVCDCEYLMRNKPGSQPNPVVARFVLLLSCPVVALLLTGCGSGRPETVPVSGKVTYGGAAVTQGKIVFHPDQGRSASGEIRPDGSYTLTTFDEGDGAVLGKHRVTIKSTRVNTLQKPPASFEDEIAMGQKKDAKPAAGGEVEWLVPRKYSLKESSDLTAEVKHDGEPINFDLPAGG